MFFFLYLFFSRTYADRLWDKMIRLTARILFTGQPSRHEKMAAFILRPNVKKVDKIWRQITRPVWSDYDGNPGFY